MTAYNKAFAAIVSALAIQWIARMFGIDVTALGIDAEFRVLVQLALDGVSAVFVGFWVWLVPNVKRWAAREPDYEDGL